MIQTNRSQKVQLFAVHGRRRNSPGNMKDARIVVFVASLHSYDESLSIHNYPDDDIEMNCMERQLQLFDEVLNRMKNIWQDAHLVLLLNKKDLFVEKIKKTSNYYMSVTGRL